MTNPDALVRKADLSHQLTLICLLGCMLLFALWYWLIAPPTNASPSLIALFHILPLSFFLPGISKRKPRTYIWLCFFILLYFCEGVLNAFLLPTTQGWLGLAESLLMTILFVAAMYAARWNSQHQKTVSSPTTPSS